MISFFQVVGEWLREKFRGKSGLHGNIMLGNAQRIARSRESATENNRQVIGKGEKVR